jgi:hypothetical protein
MAYLTLTNLIATDAQKATLLAHIADETNSGNTDGISTSVTRIGILDESGQLLSLSQRSWKDSASANAYIAYVNTIGCTVTYAEVVAPL